MNYSKLYNKLIERARNRESLEGYIETHHIIPKCLGGSNDTTNLVRLTPEEHYYAHLLLTKLYPTHVGLSYALLLMCIGSNGRTKRRYYGWKRRKFSELMSITKTGKSNNRYGTKWIHNPYTKEQRVIYDDDVLPNGFMIGRTSKTCSGINCTKYIKTKNKYCKMCSPKFKNHGKVKKAGKQYYITNGIIDKKIYESEEMPSGFIKGRTNGMQGRGSLTLDQMRQNQRKSVESKRNKKMGY